ncbi:hypothetical protein EOD39_3953 [Acipenser ruthenus]|uniref:Uncharacterized protein n=1 Tax=Acipenser ruthenus TaxID=7906 RepID=A0A444UKH9_ACIRT|nr:hypothetical protein EOD39_3953 [Acipenser ruthenus]
MVLRWERVPPATQKRLSYTTREKVPHAVRAPKREPCTTRAPEKEVSFARATERESPAPPEAQRRRSASPEPQRERVPHRQRPRDGAQHHQRPKEREPLAARAPEREPSVTRATERETHATRGPERAPCIARAPVGAVLANLCPAVWRRAVVPGSPDPGLTAIQDWHGGLELVAALEPRDAAQPLKWSSHCVAVLCPWQPHMLPNRDQVSASRSV